MLGWRRLHRGPKGNRSLRLEPVIPVERLLAFLVVHGIAEASQHRRRYGFALAARRRWGRGETWLAVVVTAPDHDGSFLAGARDLSWRAGYGDIRSWRRWQRLIGGRHSQSVFVRGKRRHQRTTEIALASEQLRWGE